MPIVWSYIISAHFVCFYWYFAAVDSVRPLLSPGDTRLGEAQSDQVTIGR